MASCSVCQVSVQMHVVNSQLCADSLHYVGADDANMDNILEKAGSLSHISAIIMVANGSQTRQTITMKNVFTLLRGHLPDAVLKNTLVVLSNCTKLTRSVTLLLCTAMLWHAGCPKQPCTMHTKGYVSPLMSIELVPAVHLFNPAAFAGIWTLRNCLSESSLSTYFIWTTQLSAQIQTGPPPNTCTQHGCIPVTTCSLLSTAQSQSGS